MGAVIKTDNSAGCGGGGYKDRQFTKGGGGGGGRRVRVIKTSTDISERGKL